MTTVPEPDEPAEFPVPVLRLRGTAEIRAVLEAYVNVDEDFKNRDGGWHYRGVVETLRWAVGDRPDAPVSETVLDHPLGYWDVSRERGYAERAWRGEIKTGMRADYLLGVEHTTSWLPEGGDGIGIPRRRT
jgi:hypothetical protein